MSNILSGFWSTDIYPIDRNVFDQSKFLPASVIDISLSIDDNIGPKVAVSTEDAGIAQGMREQCHFHK